MSHQTSDTSQFQHYSLKSRAISWISRSFFDHLTYTQRHGLIKGMRRRGGLGWLPTETQPGPEELFWQSRDFSGMVVYDVGAFHGLLTLYFAKKAKQVVSYEPNSRNHARLLENVRLNGLTNVIVRKAGLGAEAGKATMAASSLMPGGASIADNTVAGLMESQAGVVTESISITTLDEDVTDGQLPPPDFIKIDIEGLELPALQGARNLLALHKPKVFVELHGETMDAKRQNVARVVAYMMEIGYCNILHVESGSAIDRSNSEVAARGHLYFV